MRGKVGSWERNLKRGVLHGGPDFGLSTLGFCIAAKAISFPALVSLCEMWRCPHLRDHTEWCNTVFVVIMHSDLRICRGCLNGFKDSKQQISSPSRPITVQSILESHCPWARPFPLSPFLRTTSDCPLNVLGQSSKTHVLLPPWWLRLNFNLLVLPPAHRKLNSIL